MWQYGEAKQQGGHWKTIRMTFAQDGRVIGAAQANLRMLPFVNRGLIWLSRAPLLFDADEQSQASQLEAIFEQLKEYWVNRQKMYLRIAPNVAFSKENLSLFARLGYSIISSSPGWTSMRIDLTLPLDTLMKQMRKNWRQSLQKSMESKMVINEGLTTELLKKFSLDLRELRQTKDFRGGVTSEFVGAIIKCSSDETILRVFSAELAGQHLGSIIIAYYGDMAFYLAGAVNDIGRHISANHNLLWQAIQHARSEGYRWFDLGGAHPVNTPPGILYFKQGLGGQEYQLMSEIEACPAGWTYKILKKIIAAKR